MNERFDHRCSDARVSVTDKNGTPLAGVPVRFHLTNHEFLFGMGAFDTLSIGEHSPFAYRSFKVGDKTIDRAFFRERVDLLTAAFNYGTLPFYWGGYEMKEGEPQFENRMEAAQYLKAHGVTPKGHPLCWHTSCADWLLKYDNKTIMDKQLARIDRDVTAFKGVIDIWDVINETVIMPVFDRYDNAITRICNAYGRLTLIKEVFAAAHAANPDALLLINDFNLSPNYQKVIEECLDAGVPIGAIGIQTHQHQGYKGLAWLNDVLERFSQYGIPLHFTENTLISGQLMPPHIVDLNDYQVEEWPSTPEGEERQEREWREMYETLFGNPAVTAITGWDLADGAWLHAPSGLLRLDNSTKPSYRTLKKLIKEDWTTDVTLVTDANGQVNLHGVRGTYEAAADGRKAEFVLSKNTPAIQIEM